MLDEKEIFQEIASHKIRLEACYHLSFGPMGFGELQKQLDVSAHLLAYHLHDKKHLIAEGIVEDDGVKYHLNISPPMVEFVRGVYDDGDFWGRVRLLESSCGI